MNDDATLLRSYADQGSEAAFAELVRRHLDLVYGAALRRTGGDPHRAKDVAQQVFTTLARDARRLSRHTVLVAWLHTATRHAALNLMISDQRRRKREGEALALDLASAPGGPAPDWEQVRPLLDAAIDELPEPDRAAVVMRFLERHAFADIGAALRVSEEAARKRTDRALEKLRAALARRGITSTAAALGALVAAQPVMSAPAGLAALLATQATATAGSATLAATVLSFMTAKIITTATLGIVLGFLAGTHFGSVPAAEIPAAAPAVDAARQDQAATTLRRDNERLAAERSMQNAEIARLKAANATLSAAAQANPSPAPLPTENITLGMARWEIQQASLNNLRQIDAGRRQFQLEKGRIAGSIHDLIGRGGYIKTMRTVNGEDYAKVSMNPADPLTVTTPNGIEVTYDPDGPKTTKPDIPPEVLRAQEITNRLQPVINQALSAYRAANNGKGPPDEQALLPYFPTPKDGADFVELVEARKAAGL